ncbi:glycoprotein hormone alpha 2 [Arctopsyche grandis]|uniref:glycoprotein hormone alpha 2 n=1 Tax=Arctopsyche grandis TaxID=121162 RepID=UPI00406DA46A
MNIKTRLPRYFLIFLQRHSFKAVPVLVDNLETSSQQKKMFPRLAALMIALVVSGTLPEVSGDSPSVMFGEKPAWQRPGCHRLGHSKKVSIPGCTPFTVTTNACRGFCESWAFPSTGRAPQPVTSLAQCCNIMDSEDIVVKVPCLEGERTITMKSATTCSCYHCRKD